MEPDFEDPSNREAIVPEAANGFGDWKAQRATFRPSAKRSLI
jgi:hypothetical protein